MGDGTKKKIKEFLENGKFQEVKDPFVREKMEGLKELQEIFAVGQEKALKLYNEGYTSVELLKQHENEKGRASRLTPMQKIGLKYFYDLKERMPRN